MRLGDVPTAACRLGAGLLLAAGLACKSAAPATSAPPIVKPGAPGQPSRTMTTTQAADLSKVAYTKADVEFMQGMIGHHSQAVEMVELLKTRTSSETMQLLGKRIELSQDDEIKMMQRWLQDRGQALPDPHAHHHGGAMMPGMLSAEQMERLAAAKGPEFDRLFLEYMIQHHQGALVMVDALMKQSGAAQESEMYAFASDIVADQQAEIDRMHYMLGQVH